MCECSTAGRPCGLVNRVRAWLAGPAGPEGPSPPAAGDWPFPTCDRCGVILEGDDAESMHEGWCYQCDSNWFESQICAPLVSRLGKHGACRALAKLVRNVRSLT